ncbi:MAG: hypothetical protein N2C14_22685, partial [Planctomycetales bacterium]
LVWGLAVYRWPLVAGLFLGCAAAAIYYPVCLLPLFCGFYWKRGLRRFLIGVGIALGGFALLLAFTIGFDPLWNHLPLAIGWTPSGYDAPGVWGLLFDPAYRLPIAVAFGVLCCSFVAWPVRKNFGSLLSCSAAMMLGLQLWAPLVAVANLQWCLPLLLLTVFRPNLENHVALFVRGEGWRLRPRVETDLQAA